MVIFHTWVVYIHHLLYFPSSSPSYLSLFTSFISFLRFSCQSSPIRSLHPLSNIFLISTHISNIIYLVYIVFSLSLPVILRVRGFICICWLISFSSSSSSSTTKPYFPPSFSCVTRLPSLSAPAQSYFVILSHYLHFFPSLSLYPSSQTLFIFYIYI